MTITGTKCEDHIDVSCLDDMFVCDPIEGVLRWKPRPVDHYRMKIWNSRFVGKIAGRLNAKGYRQIVLKSDGVRFHTTAHRVIWAMANRAWAPVHLHLDHINGNPDDNRIVNLRLCDPRDNIKNKGMYGNNTSGFKGVSWVERYQKWGVQIHINGGSKFGGYFDTAESAANAYDQLARKNFGEFARTNEMMGLL